MRLDVLADTDLQRACVPDQGQLTKWLADSTPAWFFLDARDEIALSGKLLSTALRNLNHGLGPALQRAHVLITSRPWDWQSRADRLDFETLLAAPPERTVAAEAPAPIDTIGITSAVPISKAEDDPAKAEPALTVVMAALDLKRIERLSAAWGVSNMPAFLRAIGRSAALSMAERPGDLLGLVKRWKGAGVLGTHEAVLSTMIEWRLKDSRSVPGALVQLTADQYHRGARRLAATLTLARSEAFRSPDADSKDGGPDTGVIAEEAFPDWTAPMLDAVLRTSLFDPHSFGAVRINGRSEREYLTADWLYQLHVKAALPERDLRDVLFAAPHGERIVIPALRPVAAWLAIRNEFVREELFGRDPELLLRAGDPSQLPLPVKKRLLARVVEQLLARGGRAGGFDERILNALAEPALAELIRAHWRRARDSRMRDREKLNALEEIQILLLRLIRAGELGTCSDTALEAAIKPVKRHMIQLFGMSALQRLGVANDIRRFVKVFLANAQQWPAETLRGALETFFPSSLTVAQAGAVLAPLVEKSKGPPKRESSEARRTLRAMVAAADSGPVRLELASVIAARLAPKDSREPDDAPSAEWEQLGPGFMTLIARILREDAPKSLPESVAIAFAHGVQVSPVRFEMREASKEIYSALATWPGRAELFELLIKRFDQWSPRFAGSDQPHVRSSFASDVLGLNDGDLGWLLDVTHRQAIRLEVFHALLELWLRAGRSADLRARIEVFAGTDAQLLELLNGASRKPEPSSFEKQAAARRRSEEAAQAKEQKDWLDFERELREKPAALTDAAAAQSNAHLQRLWRLRSWMELKGEKDKHQYAIANTEALETRFGPDVTAAARETFKAYWRAQWPKLPSELKPEERNSVLYSTILGLTGLAIEAREGDAWVDPLTAREVQTAVRHALRELNGLPPWFGVLTRRHAAIVYEMLVHEVRAELNEAPRNGHPELLQRLRYERPENLPDLGPHMAMILESQSVGSDRALDYLLEIVAQSDSLDPNRLVRLVKEKLNDAKTSDAQRVPYLSLLFATDARQGLSELQGWLERTPEPERKTIVLRVLAHFAGEDQAARMRHPSGSEVETLEQLILLAFKYVRYEDDVQHVGVYSPGLRDHAEHARDRLVNTLLRIAGAEAFDALERLSKSPDLTLVRSWIRQQARIRAEIDSDQAWRPRDVYDFECQHEHLPKTGRELMQLVRRRVEEIADYLAGGDFSQSELLGIKKLPERQFQLWLAGQLHMLRRGFYTVSREEEAKDRKRPDIRIHSLPADAKVSIEIKIADDGSGNELKAAFTKQLIKRYQRDPRCRHGLLVIIGLGKRKSWRVGRQTVTSLSRLAEVLRATAMAQRALKSAGLAADVIAFSLSQVSSRGKARKKQGDRAGRARKGRKG